MRKASLLLALFSAMMGIVFAASSTADARRKPKGNVDYIKIKLQDLLVSSYRLDGSTGPTLTLTGVLHLVSQPLISEDGTTGGFRLHTNLSEAFAASADGTATYVAVGASDGIPADCGTEPCLPSFWTLTFRLVPQGGSGGQSSLLFSLIVNTVYAADGSLVSACVVGQEGCGGREARSEGA